MNPDLDTLATRASNVAKEQRSFFRLLKKKNHRLLDDTVHCLHEEVFAEVDCLSCANCCRTLGPRLTDRDIDRIAPRLKLKPHELVETYLRLDEDGDYVFRQMPCPFLGADNYCAIYGDRPRACREYPHTDRKKFYQIHALTIRNATTCPAVFEILERLRREF